MDIERPLRDDDKALASRANPGNTDDESQPLTTKRENPASNADDIQASDVDAADDDEVTEASEESFPASDPPAYTRDRT